MIDNENRVILVAHDATDAEIRSLVRQTAAIAATSNKPFYLAIAGYDSDPRDLWKIPEAVSLCKRMQQHGMMTSLVPLARDGESAPGFTAIQLWAIATGRMSPDGVFEVSKEIYDLFFKDLETSNAIADGIPPDDGETFVFRSK